MEICFLFCLLSHFLLHKIHFTQIINLIVFFCTILIASKMSARVNTTRYDKHNDKLENGHFGDCKMKNHSFLKMKNSPPFPPSTCTCISHSQCVQQGQVIASIYLRSRPELSSFTSMVISIIRGGRGLKNRIKVIHQESCSLAVRKGRNDLVCFIQVYLIVNDM